MAKVREVPVRDVPVAGRAVGEGEVAQVRVAGRQVFADGRPDVRAFGVRPAGGAEFMVQPAADGAWSALLAPGSYEFRIRQRVVRVMVPAVASVQFGALDGA